MTPNTSARRPRYASLGLPAAVLGALAGALIAAPAEASADASTDAGLATLPLRVVPADLSTGDHVVAPGDTVFAIAGRYGLRTADVLAWNGLDANSVIRPGQTLTLLAPASAPSPTTAPTPHAAPSGYTVVTGDTLFGIAQRHGISLDALLGANGLDRASIIYPGQTLALTASTPAATPAAAPAPAPEPTASATYTVVAGDTLFGIAQRHGLSLDALLSANGLDRASIIYPGQSLAVMASTPAPAAAAPPAAAPPAAAPTPAGQRWADLTDEQAGNAALIIRVGRELGVSDRGIAIALATGMVESGLRNLDWGDRDSLGIFQQRPSTGWGSPEQVRDADRSARVFYGGSGDPNGQTTRGLLDIPGWEGMAFTDAAQAVQISAYPLRYGEWETAAYRWLALYR